jgi:NAD(P)-dependent dehydrogenase (short-subunit alcohol dehydrogenase family)
MAAKRAQSRSQRSAGVLRLRGRVAVVTGGSRGIGYAIAQTLAAEGCSVVITGRDAATLKKSAAQISKSVSRQKKPPQIVAQVCDVRDPNAVSALFAEVKKRFGKLDILVNNAGISQAPTPVPETSVEMWRNMLDTNLTGVCLGTRAALPLMRAGATIINNISAAAKQVFPAFSAYTAAKHGAYGFTLALREELIPRGIRVTALMPGATDTEIWQQIMPDVAHDQMINVENVAQAVLYAVLLPPEANLSELLVLPTCGSVGAKSSD